MSLRVYHLLTSVGLVRIGCYLLLSGVICMMLMCWNLPNQNRIREAPEPWNRLPQGNSSLLDLPNFKYHINNNVCGKDAVFLVIVLHSATDHSHNRNTIRKTWASPKIAHLPVKTIFMLAEPKDYLRQRLLEDESNQHGDIVQGNFADSYRNLTYKHVMTLKWVSTHCPQARFVMKMDDDIFVDIYQLLSLLQRPMTSKLNDGSIACYFQTQMPVVRDPTSKWYVSKGEYTPDIFDDYCSGWAYLINPKTADVLAKTAAQFRYFWVDDVHITGRVAAKANIRKIRMNQYFAIETQGLVEWVKKGGDQLWNKIFAPTWGDMDLMTVAHRRAQDCYKVNCTCCYVPPIPKSHVPKFVPPPTGKSMIIQIFHPYLKKTFSRNSVSNLLMSTEQRA